MTDSATTNYLDNWLGAPMAWSHWDGETYVRLLREAEFTVISAEEIFEPDESSSHLWVVAQKPAPVPTARAETVGY